MKTAQNRRDEARKKELELAAAKGITPEDVKEGENPPPAAATPPADPPATPTPPATPPPAPDKPAETPPAQGQPPAAADGSPQPPADTDYKAVAEQERTTRLKVEAANEELRVKFNRELTTRQKLELQNRVLQIGVKEGQPAAATPANGGDPAPAQPPASAPPSASLAEIEAEIKKATAELNDQAGEEIASRLSDLSRLHAKHAATSAVNSAMGAIQQRYDPVLESAQADIRQNAADARDVKYTEARKVIAVAHPNWESIVNSEPFQTWVANHPMAYQYQLGLNPGDSGMGFTPEGVVRVLAEFSAQDPVLQATLARDAEASAREAAAAKNEGAALSTTPTIDNFGEGPKVLRSEFIRQSQEVKNDIPALKALVAKMDQAVATGNFVDDIRGR